MIFFTYSKFKKSQHLDPVRADLDPPTDPYGHEAATLILRIKSGFLYAGKCVVMQEQQRR